MNILDSSPNSGCYVSLLDHSSLCSLPWGLVACAHRTPSLPTVSMVNTLHLARTLLSRLRINSTSAASRIILPCFHLLTHLTKLHVKQSLIFFNVFLNWSIIALRCCVSFCSESAVCKRVFPPSSASFPPPPAPPYPQAITEHCAELPGLSAVSQLCTAVTSCLQQSPSCARLSPSCVRRLLAAYSSLPATRGGY